MEPLTFAFFAGWRTSWSACVRLEFTESSASLIEDTIAVDMELSAAMSTQENLLMVH